MFDYIKRIYMIHGYIKNYKSPSNGTISFKLINSPTNTLEKEKGVYILLLTSLASSLQTHTHHYKVFIPPILVLT